MGRIMSVSETSARQRWLVGLIWIFILAFSGWFASTPLGKSIDRSINNWHWRMGAVVQPDSRFVLVDIDERSLAIEGGWPWSRPRISDLVKALQDSGASEITLDMMFPDAKPGDDELSERFLVTPRPVVAMTFALPGNEAVLTGELPGNAYADLCRIGLFPEAIGYIGQSNTLTASVGHIVPRIELDGVLRETPAFVCFEDQAYPALTLRAFLNASGLGESIAVRGRDQKELVIDNAVRIPLSSRGGVRIPYHQDSASFDRVSASDVMAGIVDLNGRWAVVGSSAVGLSDRVSTPLAPLETGALAHIRLLSALLDQQFPTVSLGGQLIVWFASAVLSAGLLISSLTRQLRWWVTPLAVVISSSLLIGAVGVYQTNYLLLIDLVGPLSALVIGGVAATALAFFQFRSDQVALVGRLTAYLPSDVAGRIAHGVGLGAVDMHSRSGILMSLDLRNFDRWAEHLESNLTAALLHHYTTLVSDRVRVGGGQILQVNGTSVRILWSTASEPERVLQTADALQSDLEQVFPSVELDPALPPMSLMIGIEKGSMLLGTYGSETSRGFTLLGDTQRVAQALVRMSTELSTPCVIGPEFAKVLPSNRLQSLGVFLLEESATPRELFEAVNGIGS